MISLTSGWTGSPIISKVTLNEQVIHLLSRSHETKLGVCRSQGSLFEPRFLSQGCNFGKYSLAKGIFFFTKSLAKGIFLTKPPQNWLFGAKLWSFFGKFLNKGIFGIKLLKIMWEWAHDQEILLRQGYVFDQNFLSQGFPIKNRSHTPPLNFFWVLPPPPHPTPPLPHSPRDWAFPDCNSSSNSLMDLKWCTKLDVV